MNSKFLIHVFLVCAIFTFLCINISMAQDLKVTDIKATSGKAYKLGDKGITVGTIYYTDRTFVVNTLPKDLDGSAFIMTANDDKSSTGASFLTFTVDRAVVIWLAHDSRGEKEKGGTPPDWLSDKNGWVKYPDMKMDVSDTNMGFFIFWSKEFNKGQIALGGNADPAAAGQGSNYLVLVRPGKALAVESKGKVVTTWAKLRLTE